MKRSRTVSTSGQPSELTISSKKSSIATKKKYARKARYSFGREYGFPAQLTFKHRYFVNKQTTSSSGVPAVLQFAANGLYAPEPTGGHQPSYYDTLTGIYNHYHVVKSKLIVRCATQGGTTVPVTASLWINDDTTGTTTVDSSEQSSAINFVVPPGGNEVVTKVIEWDAVKTFGPNPMANIYLEGFATSNPTELSYLQLNFVALDGSTTVTMSCQCELVQIAIWSEVKDVTIS